MVCISPNPPILVYKKKVLCPIEVLHAKMCEKNMFSNVCETLT